MNILITGAYSGIGYKLGCFLSKRGHKVYMTTENEEQREKLKIKLMRDMIDAITFKMDITTDDIFIIDKLDIDCLINHAGVGMGGSILEMSSDVLRENYEVNVFSSFKLLKRVYDNMVRENKRGKIFVTSSVAGYLYLPFLGCYTSSKAAITALCRSIKKELNYLNNGITLSVIEPGAYHTGFNQKMIDNKCVFLNKNGVFYNDSRSINRLQKNLFRLIEKDDYSDLVKKIVKEIESDNPKFMIRSPGYISFLLKAYFLIWG